MKILGIIPARYASTRFPGKPLVNIDGISMIQRVYEQCTKATALHKIIIATDDHRIYNHIIEFNGNVIMTSPQHQSGTDRCAEIANMPEFNNYDVVVNIQGDEPYIQPEQINLLASTFQNKKVQIATLVKKIISAEELFNHNLVKVVLNINQEAIYFSRSPIPFNRNFPENEWLKFSNYYKHIGIYGYQKNTLVAIAKLDKTNLEITEALEQLRWIENGIKINTQITTLETIAIDTPDDLKKVKL